MGDMWARAFIFHFIGPYLFLSNFQSQRHTRLELQFPQIKNIMSKVKLNKEEIVSNDVPHLDHPFSLKEAKKEDCDEKEKEKEKEKILHCIASGTKPENVIVPPAPLNLKEEIHSEPSEQEDLYPNGIHYSLAGLLDDDIIKIIAQRVHIQLKEVFDNHRSYVDDVVIDKDDPRVCNIHTCKNSYVALAQPVECPMGPAPIGLLIGGEDCGGLDPAWVNTLGWKSKYGKDVEPLGDY